MDEATSVEINRHIDGSVKDIGKWGKLDHLKMTDEEVKGFGDGFLRAASETAVAVYSSSELANNMPSLIEATRKYIDCFRAGVENFGPESISNLTTNNIGKESEVVDREITQRGINAVTYPNESERKLMTKLGREAFLTGRTIAQIEGHKINSASLGIATFGLLEDDSKNRVAENTKALLNEANAVQKGAGSQLDYFLQQNRQSVQA